jgi:5'-3' exonuclease
VEGEAKETLHDIVGEIKEEYFSDLNPEDIPNSEVSDIEPDELAEQAAEIGAIEEGADLKSKIEITR